MPESQEMTVSVTGNESVRGGYYTNFQRITSSSSETIVDFLFIDDFDSEGNPLSGTVQTRAVMTNEKFARFADLVRSHIEKGREGIEDGD